MEPNIFEPELDEGVDEAGFRVRATSFGERMGSERLGASLYELGPGDTAYPYHWHAANEELLMVISGMLELRGPSGARTVEAGELVGFPRGERGAHQLVNRGSSPARYLMLSEMNYPEICVYPDADKVGIREVAPAAGREGMRLNFVRATAVDYWHDEQAPES